MPAAGESSEGTRFTLRSAHSRAAGVAGRVGDRRRIGRRQGPDPRGVECPADGRGDRSRDPEIVMHGAGRRADPLDSSPVEPDAMKLMIQAARPRVNRPGHRQAPGLVDWTMLNAPSFIHHCRELREREFTR